VAADSVVVVALVALAGFVVDRQVAVGMETLAMAVPQVVAVHHGCLARIASHSMAVVALVVPAVAGVVVVLRFPLSRSIKVGRGAMNWALHFPPLCLTSISYSRRSDNERKEKLRKMR
jgi:hypothetical protein